MQIRFTKMHGAGNDFVVLDETRQRLPLTAAHYRYLADRHFGVGADQILTVRPGPQGQADFEYIIHNADGGEVQQCGNGARCFARYVHDKGLTQSEEIRVLTRAGIIVPRLMPDGRVRVDMGRPVLEPARVPFDAQGLTPEPVAQGARWPLALPDAQGTVVPVAVVSMGNPHAVQWVADVENAPVQAWGPLIERHARFPERVNAGFGQIVDRGHLRLRVYERGAGETLACGTGACAAVVAGITQGLLDPAVEVTTRGGLLRIEWSGRPEDAVYMTGPATTVFEGVIDIPEEL